MMKRTILCLILVLITVPVWLVAQEVIGVEKVIPFSSSEVTLLPSWVKHREELNTTYLQSLDPDRLLHNFRVNAGLPSSARPLEGWEAPHIGLRGHFVGHYLSAISCLIERYHDARLVNTLNYMVEELYKCQQALGNGYLSAFPEKDFETLETKCSGVWAPYYTYLKIMQGLLDAYTRAGNKIAYEMVVRMADYVDRRMSRLDSQTIERILYSVGANPSNEAGAMNEVLYKLYKVSRNPRHLALAKLFDRNWFLLPLSQNKDILSGLHANTHLVLVNGFAQGYSITKEPTYRDAAINFWDMLIHKHAYVNGSSSGPRPNVVTRTSLSAEHWGVPGHLSNKLTKEIAESCVSHNTQKLTSMLFSWTLDPQYTEVYVNTFYNSIMALQNGRTGACVYHLPLGSPREKLWLKENDFRCCNGSTLEAFASLNNGIYYHNDSSLWVNLYVSSEVEWEKKGICIRQSGDFPKNDTVCFSVSTSRPTEFQLNLFIPSWAEHVDMLINGEKLPLKALPGTYVNIHRTWKSEDTLRLIFHPRFYIKTMPDDENVIAIFYGSSLLAFEDDSEVVLKGSHQDIINNLRIEKEDELCFSLYNHAHTYTLRPLYNIENQKYGVYATIRDF